MKQLACSAALSLSVLLLFNGCVAAVGSGPKTTVHPPTIGQQLIDLQNARNAGAINDAQYQQQKARLLEAK